MEIVMTSQLDIDRDEYLDSLSERERDKFTMLDMLACIRESLQANYTATYDTLKKELLLTQLTANGRTRL
jgi:hypothetical protein